MVRSRSCGGWLFFLLIISMAEPVFGQNCPSASVILDQVIKGMEISDASQCDEPSQLQVSLEELEDLLAKEYVEKLRAGDRDSLDGLQRGLENLSSALRETELELDGDSFWQGLIEEVRASGVNIPDVSIPYSLMAEAVARKRLQMAEKEMQIARRGLSQLKGEIRELKEEEGRGDGEGFLPLANGSLNYFLYWLVFAVSLLTLLGLVALAWLIRSGRMASADLLLDPVMSKIDLGAGEVREGLEALETRLDSVLSEIEGSGANSGPLPTKDELATGLRETEERLRKKWRNDLAFVVEALQSTQGATEGTGRPVEREGSRTVNEGPVPPASIREPVQGAEGATSAEPRAQSSASLREPLVNSAPVDVTSGGSRYSAESIKKQAKEPQGVDLPGLDELRDLPAATVRALLRKSPTLEVALDALERKRGLWGAIAGLVDRGVQLKKNLELTTAWQEVYSKRLKPYWVGMVVLKGKRNATDAVVQGGKAVDSGGGGRANGEKEALLALRELAKFSPQQWARQHVVRFTRQVLELRDRLDGLDPEIEELLGAALEVLQEVGLKPIPIQEGVSKAVSQRCEIVNREERGDLDENVITSVVRHGFYYPEKDEVLEPAKVVVSHRPRGQA